MSKEVKIDISKIKRRDYSYESYTNEGKKLHSNHYSGTNNKNKITGDKKGITSDNLKQPNPYMKPYGYQTTNPKDIDLNKKPEEKKKGPIILSIVIIIVGILLGFLIVFLRRNGL